MRVFWPIVCGCAALWPCGCSGGGPEPIPFPAIDAEAAARQALAEYDANADGFLDVDELAKCPPLKNSMTAFDRDGDEKLSAAEIAARLRTYAERDAALIGLVCQVTLNGQPLPDATVTFVPERFLGTNIRPASGVTNEQGYVRPQTVGMDVAGVQYGLFRIEVSQQGSDGAERLPAKYNSATTLGLEMTGDTVAQGAGSVIALSSP